MNSAPGRRTNRAISARADNRHRRDLNRRPERESIRADRGASVPSVRAEHLDEQVRGAVDDLRLIGEPVGRLHEAEHLDELDYAVEADRLLDLRQHAEPAKASAAICLLDRDLVGASTAENPVAFSGDLARNVK